MSWSEFPKVELHLHLEGAAPPAFIRGLAKEKSMDISGVFDQNGNYAYRDFSHFLSVYEAATETLKSPEDYHRLTLAVLEECAANGVVYAETFLSPDFCGGSDVAAWRDYLAAIQDAADQAQQASGIHLRGIVTCIRHFGPEKARASAKCAAETAGDWLTGFGIGGAETMGELADFSYAFDMAREAGLELTAHAGEWSGPRSVRDAVEKLGVGRVGHGVRAIEDPALVEVLAERGIVLEVCPGSNVVLGVYPRWKDHPIQRLREAGVQVTVSTDDPPFFHTTMTREFEMLERTFGWGEAEFDEINQTALAAAYCDEATRTRVGEMLKRT